MPDRILKVPFIFSLCTYLLFSEEIFFFFALVYKLPLSISELMKNELS